MEENIGSTAIERTREDLDESNTAASKIPVRGERLRESILRVFR